MQRSTAAATLAFVCFVGTACSGDDQPSAPTINIASTPAASSVVTVPSVPETSSPEPSSTIASSTTEPSTTDIPSTTVIDGLPEVQRIADVDGVKVIDAEPFPDWITIADGAAWVANVSSGVVGYDLASGAPLFDVPTGVEVCLAMDSTPGSLWVGACDTTTLYRVDTIDGTIAATILLPFDSIAEESSIAANEEFAWVMSAGANRQIAQISAVDDSIVTTFDAPAGASAMRFADGSLWISDAGGGTVHRVDPETGEQQALLQVGAGAGFVAVGEGGVWVMNGRDGTVSFIDPATNTVGTTIKVSDDQVDGGDIAVGGGYVWARVSDVVVVQIDPGSDSVVARYGPSFGSGSVAADDGAVWVSAHNVLKVWRIPISE